MAIGTLATLLASSGAGFIPSGVQLHACTDHVCTCRAAATPAPVRAADAPCHGTPSRPASTTLQSTCDHDRDGFTAAPVMVALLPVSPAIAAMPAAPMPAPADVRPWPQAARPETPPPRSASC